MYTITVTSNLPSTLLVAAGGSPALITNADLVNTVYLGLDNTTSPGNSANVVPLAAGQSYGVDGSIDIYGVTNTGIEVEVYVVPSGTSFFQPISQLVIIGTAAAVLLYSPVAGLGNLIGSWAAASFTDAYGNVVPQGLVANGGTLNGILLNNPSIVGGVIANALLTAPNITSANMAGGTITETAITFDSTGGLLLGYTTTTTTQTFSTPGFFTCNIPAGVSTADVRVWGGDAGAGGGSPTRGGEGGGAAEVAREPNYNVAGNNGGNGFTVQVGALGTGGTTGFAGNSGGDSFFDAGNVYAQGGQAGGNFIGGLGGNISTNTIHFPGGNGGGNGSQSTGGCGGGGRAGLTGAGGNAGNSTGSGGSAGGTAGTGIGGHAGGAGGAAGANGTTGGGGGGCGAATQANQGSNSYRLSSSAAYYGTDATGGNAGQQKNTGTMWQGGETASGGSFNGTQRSLGIISGNPQSDLSGKTIDSVSIRLQCLHTWYNSGATVYLGYTGNNSLPGSYTGGGTAVANWTQAAGNPKTTNLTNQGLGSALQSGAAQAIQLGPGSGSFNLQNYASFYGAGGSSSDNPLITVNWHTGSTPVQAGNGLNGLVTVTYSLTSTLVLAVAPVAGTDANSNAYGSGFTGQIQAFQPGSSPTAVETWHAMGAFGTNFSHGSPAPEYKLNGDNTVSLAGQCNIASGTTSGTIVTLPTGYIPLTTKKYAVPISAGTPATSANAQITINSSGNIILSAGPTGASYNIAFDGIRFPLDY